MCTLDLDNVLKISELLLKVIALICTIFGAIIAYKKWSNNQAWKRADYVYELLNKVRTDSDIKEIFHIIDYDSEVWYPFSKREIKEALNSPSLYSFEQKMDYTLGYFSHICYLHKLGIILDSDFAPFKYHINRTCKNHQVQSYLFNLYHFAKLSDSNCAFKYLIDYGLKSGLISSDFRNKDSKHYYKDLIRP